MKVNFTLKIVSIVILTVPSYINAQEQRWYNSDYSPEEVTQSRFDYDYGKCNYEAMTVYPNLAPLEAQPPVFSSNRNRGSRGSIIDIHKKIPDGAFTQGMKRAEHAIAQRKRISTRFTFLNSCLNVKGWQLK